MKQLEDLSRYRVNEAIQGGVNAQRIHRQITAGKRRQFHLLSFAFYTNLAENLTKHLRTVMFGDRLTIKKQMLQIMVWLHAVINRKGGETNLTSR